MNTHLAKKPRECLEYIVVHEMVHLIERHHNDRFRVYMDQCMPQWQRYREQLNAAPLARGDLSRPKTKASGKPFGVSEHVIERIHQLKSITLEVRAGRAIRRFPAVKSSGRDDVVFQAVEQGGYMNDHNVLARHLKPAAKAAGIPAELVTWRSLRTSRATWLVESGADVKAIQALMRHTRVQTTLDIYAQFVPESQFRANEKVDRFLKKASTRKDSTAFPEWKHNGSRSVQ